MSTTAEVLLTNIGAISLMMLGVWVFSLIRKDAGVVDIFWGLGFVLVAWCSYLVGQAPNERKLIVAILITLWGVRLATHIFRRNWGNEEDYRYKAMREKHGKNFAFKSLYTVFGFQAAMMWLVSLPIQAVAVPQEPKGLSFLLILGIGIALFGLIFETVSDRQLELFKADKNNRGKVMNRGLWRYSRHPNYFGEAVVWWGIGIAAIDVTNGFLALISPLLITLLLTKFSGVPLLEKKMAETKPGFREYMQETSSFIPLPVRKH